jgi:hypothetical protein
MKKLVMVVMLVAAVYGAWRWQSEAPADKRRAGLAFNRMWIDHLPNGEKDPFNILIFAKPESIGGFAEETIWTGRIERFRYEADGETIRAVFPATGEREQLTVKARACDEADMDFCLEISGTKRGVSKYYSRSGWERHDIADLATFRAELLREAK